jgi:putative PIN family toxin of toxin-antitoxin system
VLARPKFAARKNKSDAEELIALLKARAIFVISDSVSAIISRDPKDDVYLACSATGDADVLITGDQDLLVLKTHGRTRILTPAQFLYLLEAP